MKEHTTIRKHSKYSETELAKLKKEARRSQAQAQNFKSQTRHGSQVLRSVVSFLLFICTKPNVLS